MRRPILELALAVPWLITEPALSAMLAFAGRDAALDRDAAAQALHGPSFLATRDGKPLDYSRTMTSRDRVACIRIEGPIFRYADFFTEMSAACTTDQIARDVHAALDDPAIDALFFVIDSPGGEALGINELADMIYASRTIKPSTAYIDGYGASAAYWIASAAGEIVVDDTALIGSIGTVMSMLDPTHRRPNEATKFEFVSSQSPNKRPDPNTERGRGQIQSLVDSMTDVFIAKVARNRGITPDQVLAQFGQGGLLVGQAAVDAGMADRLGSEEETLKAVIQQAAERRRPSYLRPIPSRTAQASEAGRLIASLRRSIS